MNNRLELQAIFEEILESRNVYFQPPESVKLKYPCIVYQRSRIDNQYASDTIYTQRDSYEVTVIDQDPDSDIVRRVSMLPMCRHNRHFKMDNLNHDVFTIYYQGGNN